MSKIQDIKAAQLEARKADVKDYTTISLLTTIIGEAEVIGKNAGNRESTDAEVIQVLKKFEKNQMENLKIFTERQVSAAIEVAVFELEIIRKFLPAKISDGQIIDDIKFIIGAKGLAFEQKSLGVITKSLKEKYGDQFDGQQISTLFKTFL